MAVCTTWADGELLGFDLETTGVDPLADRPVSFALVTVLGGAVVRRSTSLVDPAVSIPVAAPAVHGITTAQVRKRGMALSDAVELMVSVLLRAGARGVPLVGMKLDFDLTMLDTRCRAMCGEGLVELGWSGPVLDGLVLDRRFDRYRKGRRTLGDLCTHYAVAMARAHDAACDAEAAVGVVRAMCARFPELLDMTPQELHDLQSLWHREWAVSFDQWCRARDRVPLTPTELDWPIRRASELGCELAASG
jgi:DNA polymerase-3 subunit epsilon